MSRPMLFLLNVRAAVKGMEPKTALRSIVIKPEIYGVNGQRYSHCPVVPIRHVPPVGTPGGNGGGSPGLVGIGSGGNVPGISPPGKNGLGG
jgi:hypothetical protein